MMTAPAVADPAPPRGRGITWQRRLTTSWLSLRATVAERTVVPRGRLAPVTQVVSVTAWWVLVLSLVALAAGFILEWNELRVAGFFGLVLLAICVAFIFGGARISSELGLGRDRVVVGDNANGRLILTNDSGRRVLPQMIELPVGQGRAAFELKSLAAHESHEELFRIPTNRRAVLDVGPVRGVRADPLGLLRRELVLGEQHVLYVHPKTSPLAGSAAGILRDLEGETVRKLTDHDVAFHALRNYVPGDDRRYIHWKSTARSGTLMVRQFEETRRSHLLVALSTLLSDYAHDEEFETAVSVAGSLGLQTLKDAQQLTVSTATRHLKCATATSLLDQLSGVAYEAHAPGVAEAGRRQARDNPAASIVALVCGSLTESSELRRARRCFPADVRVLGLVVDHAAPVGVRRMGDLHVVSLASLADLAPSLRRLAA